MAYVPTLEAALSGLVTGDRIVKLVPGASSPYFGLPEVLIHATVSNVSVRGISFHVFGWHQVRARAHAPSGDGRASYQPTALPVCACQDGAQVIKMRRMKADIEAEKWKQVHSFAPLPHIHAHHGMCCCTSSQRVGAPRVCAEYRCWGR